MHLKKYNPLETLWNTNLWDTFFKTEEERSVIKPQANIYEDDKNYFLEMEVPGVDKKDISVEVKIRTLIIKGEKQKPKKENKQNIHLRETWSGIFQREFTIGKHINIKKIAAAHKNGILHINLPKNMENFEKKTSQKIEIS